MKNYFFIFLLCLSSANLFSQESQNLSQGMKGKLSLGWEFGVNRSYLVKGEKKYDSFFKFEEVSGYKASVFSNYNLSDHWSFNGALDYERKGTAVKNNYNELHRLHYLGVSLAPSFSYKRFHSSVGFYFAYLVKATDEIDEGNALFAIMEADKFFPFDAGLKMSLGASLLKRFGIFLTYDFGIANINSVPYYGANGHSIYGYWHRRNRSFSISVRTTFKLIQIGRM